MSVKIKRREEKRNTALPKFLLSAALPLLLVGWLGFSLGKTSKQDQAVSRATATQERTRAEKAESQVYAWNTYVTRLDSLRERAEEEVERQTELMNDAFNSLISDPLLGMDALGEWRRSSRKTSLRLLEKKDDLVNDAIRQNPSDELQLTQTGNILENFINESYLALYNKKDLLVSRHNDGQSIRSDCDDRLEELNDHISDLEDDLEDEQQDKADLRATLLDCRQEAMVGGQQPVNNNPNYKAEIESALGRLTQFSDQLGTGFLGLNANARSNVQGKITTEVGVIRTSLSNIE